MKVSLSISYAAIAFETSCTCNQSERVILAGLSTQCMLLAPLLITCVDSPAGAVAFQVQECHVFGTVAGATSAQTAAYNPCVAELPLFAVAPLCLQQLPDSIARERQPPDIFNGQDSKMTDHPPDVYI